MTTSSNNALWNIFLLFAAKVHHKQPHEMLRMLYFTELSPADTG